MPIAPFGIKVIIFGLALAAAGGFLIKYSLWLGLPPLALGLIFSLFSLYFFRDPKRNGIFAPNEISSPGDGTVLSIKNEGQDGVIVIRIFLSIFNVHVQRAPVSGKVCEIKFNKGKFAIAYKPEAKDNQRNLITITAKDGRKIALEQITGAIARRIACYVKTGEAVNAGSRIGMIYFGSQLALYLPDSSEILVKPGDKVFGAKTIIAKW